jgi:hypothetical protein
VVTRGARPKSRTPLISPIRWTKRYIPPDYPRSCVPKRKSIVQGVVDDVGELVDKLPDRIALSLDLGPWLGAPDEFLGYDLLSAARPGKDDHPVARGAVHRAAVEGRAGDAAPGCPGHRRAEARATGTGVRGEAGRVEAGLEAPGALLQRARGALGVSLRRPRRLHLVRRRARGSALAV